MSNTIRIPAADPARVRLESGYSRLATWYSPRKKRPGAFKELHGRDASDVREDG